MNEEKIEKLSALVDGELYDQERDSLIKEIQTDEDTRRRWQRYHMIGDTMRSTMPATVKPDLAESLNKLLADEPAILAPKQTSNSKNTYLKPLAGFAVAASVTAVAVLGLLPANDPSQSGAENPIAATEITPQETINTGSLTTNVPSGVRTVKYEGPEAANTDALNQYILNHNQSNSRMGVQGVSPYARLVGHEAQ